MGFETRHCFSTESNELRGLGHAYCNADVSEDGWEKKMNRGENKHSVFTINKLTKPDDLIESYGFHCLTKHC